MFSGCLQKPAACLAENNECIMWNGFLPHWESRAERNSHKRRFVPGEFQSRRWPQAPFSLGVCHPCRSELSSPSTSKTLLSSAEIFLSGHILQKEKIKKVCFRTFLVNHSVRQGHLFSTCFLDYCSPIIDLIRRLSFKRCPFL